MAAASGKDGLKPLRRSSSYELLPPNMSELTIVLLGSSWSERSSVGNFILDENVFNTQRESDNCVRVRGELKKEIVLINTPSLLHSHASDTEIRKHVEDCASLIDPGPHVFLLVLDSEDFTKEHKWKLSSVLGQLADQSFDHSLILIRGENYRSQTPLKDMVKKCGYRYLKMENLENEELLTRLCQTAKENIRGHLSCDADLSKTPSLNLVLCGRRGVGKTSAAEAILGLTELCSISKSSECVKYQGLVCGRLVSLVELPTLHEKPLDEVMEKSLRCISLCEPEGIHGFILVMPVGPLTDEDKGELETIQNTFSLRANAFTMILFTVVSNPTDAAVVDFLEENTDIHELCQSCGGGYFVLNIKDRKQVSGLLDAVEKIRAKGSTCFTKDLFTEIQVKRVVDQENTNAKLKAELEDVKQRSLMGDDVEHQAKEKEEEMKRKEESLKKQHAEEVNAMKRKITELEEKNVREKNLTAKVQKEKDKCINKEREERKRLREEDEKRWKKQEETLRQDCRKKVESSETRVRLEREQKEAVEKKLGQCQKEMKRNQEAWDKEKKDIWEQRHQEIKLNWEEEKTRSRNLKEEYYHRRKHWMASCFILALFLFLSLFYILHRNV